MRTARDRKYLIYSWIFLRFWARVFIVRQLVIEANDKRPLDLPPFVWQVFRLCFIDDREIAKLFRLLSFVFIFPRIRNPYYVCVFIRSHSNSFRWCDLMEMISDDTDDIYEATKQLNTRWNLWKSMIIDQWQWSDSNSISNLLHAPFAMARPAHQNKTTILSRSKSYYLLSVAVYHCCRWWRWRRRRQIFDSLS